MTLHSRCTSDGAHGFVSGWFTRAQLDKKFGRGQWTALPRFALQQKDAWRMIDSGAEGHNETWANDESNHTTSASAVAALMRRLRFLCGAKLRGKLQVNAASRDMWKAFRQIPVDPSVQNFLVVCVWNEARCRWEFGLAHALVFGLSGAVVHFNRLPALLTAIARRWLAIPVQHFFR